MNGIRILICCPNGAGVSLMLETMVKKAASQLHLPLAQLCHCSIREGAKRAGDFDLVLCPRELAPMLSDWQDRVTVIGLNNALSRRELEERLRAFWAEHGPETR